MTKDQSKIKDWRSTGRRIGRRTLYNAYIPYECVGLGEEKCGKTSLEPPKDAPSHFSDIWPEDNRVLEFPLQVDHEDKDVQNNSLDNLNWRCPYHHKQSDKRTEKGVSTVDRRVI